MGVSVRWYDDEQTAISIVLETRWTRRDLMAAVEQTAHLLNTCTRKTPIVIDLRKNNMIPKALVARARGLDALSRKHYRAGLMIVVGANVFIVGLFDVFFKVNPDLRPKYFFVSTIAEAEVFIYNRAPLMF